MADSMSAMASPTHQIDRLRGWRVRPARTTSMAKLLPNLKRQFTRTHKQVGAFADAWDRCAPPALRDRCKVNTMRGGTARVTASSSAIVFQLDRALRGGLLQELRAACTATIARVDIKVGLVPAPPVDLDNSPQR
ncbi:MAG: DUF721 domain-containing protein [Phycisphaerae bacterium]|nr:DUF721 domain-containing protein [Phycisphaerae bacterium]